MVVALRASLQLPWLLPHTVFLSFPCCEQLHPLALKVWVLISASLNSLPTSFPNLHSEDNQCRVHGGIFFFFYEQSCAAHAGCKLTRWLAKEMPEFPPLLPLPPSAGIIGMYLVYTYYTTLPGKVDTED